MRKLFVYICFVLLLGSNAKAYFGGNSAYNIYQLASSGNIRALQNTIDNGGSLDAEDGNGQSPICYAIRNSDYVAYKNLVLLRADEHPSCVNRISKQEYESFKRGYEIRGGKIASSFSLGKAGMWTLAGIGTAGAAVGIAAAAGGGGGGGGGSSSGGSDTPTPPPTPPTPSEPCASYNLIYCVDHGVCDECIGSRPYYKLTGCQEGYVLNTKKTGCLVNTEIRTEYPLEECDENGACASAKSGEDTVYKLLSCNDGYKLSSDKMSCIKICPGYTQETCPKSAQYLSETCSEDNSYHICTNRTNVIGCNDFSLNEDKCTSCRDGYKLINGECKPKCQGYTQVSCDNQMQYIKEKCADDETYHKCASRNHREGCDILATDSDTCLLCKEGFKLNNSNICEKLCDGYTRISCDRSQYINGYCADDASYHKCEDRKKSTTGCMDVSLTEDACQSCYDGYKLIDGVCNEICAGYTNLPCNNSLEYVKETCSENSLYHKCQTRLNTEGCSNFDTYADKCTSCDKGYELTTDGKCNQVECLGYKSAACDKPTEYISETCIYNPLFHKCKQRTNVTGCSDFKLDSDTCISCISGYSINNGVCEFSCPGYTNVACNNETQYKSSTCLKDNTYHICTRRTNTNGCSTFSETSDTCTSCLQGYTLKSGRCKFDCPTMYEDECDFYTQYISEVCPTAPTYHVCTERKNTEYCTDYETYKDECTACEDEYMVKNGKCTHICPGYQKEACSPTDTYYAVSDCTDPGGAEYHKCVERTNVSGCERFNLTADVCVECKEGYTLQEGKCNDNASLCKDYVNTPCNNNTQYMPLDQICQYDSSYHKCPSRTKSIVGCKTLNPNADECSVCEEGYMLGTGTKAGECVEKCPSSEGYKKNCDTNTYVLGVVCANDSEYHVCTQVRTKIAGCSTYVVNEDKCAECSSEYVLSEDGKKCNEKCPFSQGYKQEACGDKYYISGYCIYDGSYHKCTARTKSTIGCKTLDLEKDECDVCEEGYTLQEGQCNENSTLCKDYVKTPCNTDTQYMPLDQICQYDSSYHKCVARTKSTAGCKTLNPNADECSVCESTYMPDTEDSAICVEKCPAASGYKKEACGDQYYISEYCTNDDNFHKCTKRTKSTNGCQVLSLDEDKCEICQSTYMPDTEDSAICVEKCPAKDNYKKSCTQSVEFIEKTCVNDPTYLKCKTRTHVVGCSSFAPDADKCLDCKTGYHLDATNTYCVADAAICPGYGKGLTCNNATQWTESCYEDPTYKKCNDRKKSRKADGCETPAPSSDTCQECKTGYELNEQNLCDPVTAICVGYQQDACDKTQYISATCEDDSSYHQCTTRNNYEGCDGLALDADKCLSCKTGYHISGDGCVADGPTCSGYSQGITCNTATQWTETCSTDPSYKKCNDRQKSRKADGCETPAPSSDTCQGCMSGYELNTTTNLCEATTAVCPGYAQSCDRVQYLDKTQVCEDDPSYYKCVTRNNMEGCKDLALDADKCLSCETGYHISGNKCAKDEEEVPCPDGWDRATHNVRLQYRKAYDNYTYCAWWVDRTQVANCETYKTDEDRCITCKDDYTLSEDGLTCSSETPIPSSDTLCRINDCSSYPLDTCPDNAVCECCEDGSSHYKFTGCMEGATLTGENTCSAPGPQTKTNFNVNNTVDTIVVTDDNINNYSFTKDANKYTVGFPNVTGADFDEDKDIYNAQNQNGSIGINALTEQTSFNRIFGITTPETIDKYVTYTVPTNKDTNIFNAYSDGGSESSTVSGSITMSTGIGILAPGNVYNAFTLHDPGTTTTSWDGESTKIAASGYINVSSDGYGIYSYGSVYNAYGLGSYAYTSVGSTDTKTAFGIYAPRIINAYDGGRGVVAVTKDFPRQGVSSYAVGMEGGVIYNAFNDSDKANLKISDKEYGAHGAVYVGNLNGIGMRGSEVHNAYGYKTYGLISSTATTQYFASANFTGIKSTSGFITNGARGGTGEILIDIGNTNYEGQVHQTAVGIDNQLQSFNEDINAYNGYDSLSSGLIKISGGGYGWMSTNIITGAINTHNGSPTGGIGEIRIVNNNTAINSWSHIVGLSGGNNYENSLINIVANNLDRRSTDFLPFVVGMIKEVGAYRYYDYNTDIQLVETGEIPLLFTSNSFNSSGLFNKGKIMLTNHNEGPVYGMVGLRHHYSANAANLGDIVNDTTGSIKITATAATESYGILVNNLMTVSDFNIERATKKANIINAGKIEINGGAYVYGIYGINSNITNTGNINIETVYNNEYGYHATYGIYADNSEVANTGNITIDTYGRTDKVAGIYAVNGSKVYNGGTITINGESYNKNIADGKFIYIDSSSSIINTSSLVSTTSINTEDLGGGSIVMMSGSNITAPEVSGNLILGADITQGSNNDIYVTPNLVTGDTQNLSVSSQSAMFSASINNDNSTTDGILTRKSFNSLINDSSIADYLEHNYAAGNASDLFNKLKQAESLSQLNHNISDLFGQKMLSRMTFEDMSMLREINLDMNDNMFKEEGAFALSGTVSPSSYANNVGSIGRYALNGFNHGKTSYALGISISDVSTYDDDKENSRSDRSFVMSAPIGYKTRGFELITSPKIGYAYGEYNRNGLDGTYNGKVYKRMYALMNEARYPLNWGKMKFTPSAEFNMIGFNVKGSEDNQKPYYLRIKPQRHYSVETGIGLTAEKEFSLYKLHNFKINGGLAFYHEFANPYELDVSMSEMDGTYRLHDEKRHDNRTVVRFGFDYELGEDVDVSASLLSNIDGEYRTDAACDIKYHF